MRYIHHGYSRNVYHSLMTFKETRVFIGQHLVLIYLHMLTNVFWLIMFDLIYDYHNPKSQYISYFMDEKDKEGLLAQGHKTN